MRKNSSQTSKNCFSKVRVKKKDYSYGGRQHHLAEECEYKNAICFKSFSLGHLSSVCAEGKRGYGESGNNKCVPTLPRR